MALGIITDRLHKSYPTNSILEKTAKRVAPWADVVIGAALVAIALLGMYHIIPNMTAVITLPLLGGGAIYLALSLLNLIPRTVCKSKVDLQLISTIERDSLIQDSERY